MEVFALSRLVWNVMPPCHVASLIIFQVTLGLASVAAAVPE